MANVLKIDVLVDAAKARKELATTEKTVSGFGDKLSKLQRPATIALAAVGGFAVYAKNAASEVEQALGGVDSVFGKNAATVKTWAAQAADSVGLAVDQYSNAAVKFGAQFTNMGLSQDKVLSSTSEMIRLGADLAATYGGTTAEAVNALSAAFRGEADPAERYALNLKASAIQAELAARGQDKLTGAALESARAQAIMDIAMKQAAPALGKFASEADTAAGAEQRAGAAWRNTAADLGSIFLPVARAAAALVQRATGWIREHKEIVLILGAALVTLAGVIKTAAAAQTALNIVMNANPIVRIISLILAAVAAIVALWQNCEGFRDAVTAAWTVIKSVTETVWGAITAIITGAWHVIRPIWDGAVAFFSGLWEVLEGTVRVAWGIIEGIITFVLSPIKAAWTILREFFSILWDSIKGPAERAWSIISSVVTAVIEPIKVAWSAIIGFFGDLWTTVKDGIGSIWHGIGDWFTSAVIEPIKAAWNAIIGFFGDLWNKVKEIVSSSVGWIKDIMETISDPFGLVKTGRSLGGTPLPFPRSATGSYGYPGVTGSTAPYPATPNLAGPIYYYPAAHAPAATTINITGALDPVAVARQIRDLLTRAGRRTGHVAIGSPR